MAVRQNNLQFKNSQFSFEEDGAIMVHEFGKDSITTHNFTEWIKEFTGDDRFVDVAIREKFDVEGIEE